MEFSKDRFVELCAAAEELRLLKKALGNIKYSWELDTIRDLFDIEKPSESEDTKNA
jgi:hypothetical protein